MRFVFRMRNWFLLLCFSSIFISCSPQFSGDLEEEPEYVKGGGGDSFPISDIRDDLYQNDVDDGGNGDVEGFGEGVIDGKEPGSSETPPTSTTTSSTLAFGQNIPISIDNKGAYPVKGTCDSSQGDVMLSIGSSEESVSFICENDNSFLGSLDASSVDSDPVTITIVQENGGTEVAISTENQTQHFITEWSFPEDDYVFTIPLVGGSELSYDFVVDWGDGSSPSEVSSFDDGDKAHTYIEPGNYKIRIRGLCRGFQDPRDDHSNPYFDQLVDILNYGCLVEESG